MKTIVLSNAKGGVGKTTLSTHLAAGLALMGYRVLLIDADAQGHCAHQLNLKTFGGMYRLLAQEAEWKDVLRAPLAAHWCGTLPTIGELHLLPSNGETALIPLLVSDANALRARFAEVDDFYDFAIIDSAPGPSMLHSILFAAADYILIPTQPQTLSIVGLEDTMKVFANQNAARKGMGMSPLSFMGVVPMMYQDTLAHVNGINTLEKHYTSKKVLPVIGHRTVWRDRESAKQMIYTYAPESLADREMRAVVIKIAALMGVQEVAYAS
jgi:chromosome partitioning protein